MGIVLPRVVLRRRSCFHPAFGGKNREELLSDILQSSDFCTKMKQPELLLWCVFYISISNRNGEAAGDDV